MSRPNKPVNLMRGWPSPDVLPASLLAASCQRVLSDKAQYTPILQYGADPGYEPLREGLARWLGRHYRVQPDPRRICITGGASQSLACILQSFTDPAYTRAVWVIAPCYYLACGIFADSGLNGKLRAVPEDDEGVDLEALERAIRQVDDEAGSRPETQTFKEPGSHRKLYRHIIYTVPTCSNPSGKTMSRRRREALVHLARERDALIVCDDVYDFLQWPLEGAPTPERPPELRIPRLCDIDLAIGPAANDPQGFGHAVSNGSFSKISGPGVRTGWVEASPAFVNGLSKTASTMSGGAPSQLCAGILSDMVHHGDLENHIETTVRPSLQRRHRLMMDAIREFLVPLGVQTRQSSLSGSQIYGGYFIWLTLPPEHPFSSSSIAEVAMEEENLAVGHGNMFEVLGDEGGARFDKYIRLCFAWEPEESLVEGVQRLARLLGRMQDNVELYRARSSSAQAPEPDSFK
ncbi:Valine--pyruvate aminotransferase [Purpureocillium takamizusanense]|uniref:Valine--pyruvate aminotransferase n=1 Tax=Purpureocillium takamizusanense TaxID=2060973 RepID=A0A9Q8QIS3_9HYPO|nr:Valine--pyruvate aminotransferase [Purpureocillium takamizusanense]UNI20400.1 Valine--pyruvate aminotransferase [Purpureocillium takamizusanense]